MSTNSITSVDQSIWQYLQNLRANGQTQPANASTTAGATTTQPASGATTPPASDTTAQTQTAAVAGQQVQGGRGRHHHHHGGGGGGLQQIEAAVTSALQSAQSSGSTTDPNTIIQNAIAGVLGSDGTASANGTTPAVGQTNSNNQSSLQAFMQVLQANGINAQQFQADFLTAVKDAQNGQVNSSTAFQNQTPGTLLNTTG